MTVHKNPNSLPNNKKPIKDEQKSKANKTRTFVLGDLHGAYKALDIVLKKVDFDFENDKLIFIGDLADGWNDLNNCLDLLLKIKNFIPILGNHDLYLMKYLRTGRISDNWLKFGGGTTLHDIEKNPIILDKLDIYFKKAQYYHLEGSKFFCHGGFNPKRPINKQKNINFAINRQLYNTAMRYDKQQLKFEIQYNESNSVVIREIFIGHSTTKTLKPSFLTNLINVDTGAGNLGVLTLMNVKSKEYVQSPLVSKLYKNDF